MKTLPSRRVWLSREQRTTLERRSICHGPVCPKHLQLGVNPVGVRRFHRVVEAENILANVRGHAIEFLLRQLGQQLVIGLVTKAILARGPITCLRNWVMASRWLLMYPAWLPLTSATSATVSGRSDSCQKFRISRGWPLSSTLKSFTLRFPAGVPSRVFTAQATVTRSTSTWISGLSWAARKATQIASSAASRTRAIKS